MVSRSLVISTVYLNIIIGKVDIDSLVGGTSKEACPSASCGHTSLPHPCNTFSLDSVTSLVMTTVKSLAGLKVCPDDARLTQLGVDSFEVVKIANQIEKELGEWLGSCDCHMTGLVEKLLEDSVCCVAEYIFNELSDPSPCSSGRGTTPALEEAEALRGSYAGHVTGGEASVERKRHSHLDTTPPLASKRFKRPNAIARQSCAGHVTGAGSGTVVVESWRRGQYFINGK